MRIATLCLSSCSGCHVNLLDLQEQFLELLNSTELVFSPLFKDVKEPQPCDLGLVEGAVRNREDVEKLLGFRKKSELLVSMGSCAVYGGIVGLGSAYSNRDVLETAYPASFEDRRNPGLAPRVLPVDSIVPVDFYLPGCPPPVPVIESVLGALLEDGSPTVNEMPVCAECDRIARGQMPPEIKRTFRDTPNPDECLLQQGFLCLGSVTRAGCDAPCPKAGLPCMGCRGPAHRLLVEPAHGIHQDWVKRWRHFTDLTAEEAEKRFIELKRVLYGFTLSSPILREKRTERAAELLNRVNWDRESGGPELESAR
ncbi:MAG: hypothetical protein JXA42_19230 [Anaerolineales bacterium]|nr:hypothetical protein [Anaerolineales bacterium]